MKTKILWLCLIVVFLRAIESSYKGDVVIRIESDDIEQIEFIKQWTTKDNIDIWKEASYPKHFFDVHIQYGSIESVESMLKRKGIHFSRMISQLDVLMEEERRSNMKLTFNTGYDYSKYGTYDQIVDELKNLANTHNNKVSLFNIGKSYEGREQIGIKITNGDGRKKPVIWVDGCIHAREWISTASVMYLINQLITNQDPASKIPEALSRYEFHILPVFNVDGYMYTHKSNLTRMWRKTRSKTDNKCFGADPNRNWNTHFGGVGTSPNPCSYTYHGRYAFSEVEVRNVATYLGNLRNLKSYWNIHAYGNMVLIPWSYTTDLPKDYDDIKWAGDAYVSKVSEKYGTKYIIGSPGKILYSVAGGSIDWTYETLGVKYSFALELRDKGKYGFLLPAEQIIPCGEEMTEGLVAAVLAMQ